MGLAWYSVLGTTKTTPSKTQPREHPPVGLAWYSMLGSYKLLRQMAQVSVQMAQDHLWWRVGWGRRRAAWLGVQEGMLGWGVAWLGGSNWMAGTGGQKGRVARARQGRQVLEGTW